MYYCSKECQKVHWQGGHKDFCGKKFHDRPNHAVQVVVIPCDKTMYPRAAFVDGADDAIEAMKNVCKQILKCKDN
eukprot:CAMPEP_0206212754 /NCGR_PEP_ID=MMETSP0047_2-20121206/743_1 /ASSEMBLY_ACC=CAM_ASM_000192 /TAXON_ID=195065 /ORGANISM="Chroomonas mesostigmatica_cf, Strain CCMP1168" /LENGTH=74 /DNA_ID=CAMNT_0053634829 /DNA_START=93 /DNA_END=314 /DNA_ORIENTATION=+